MDSLFSLGSELLMQRSSNSNWQLLFEGLAIKSGQQLAGTVRLACVASFKLSFGVFLIVQTSFHLLEKN